jgi:hypothetical protein
MFELTKEAYDCLRCQFGTLKRGELYMEKGRRGKRDNVGDSEMKRCAIAPGTPGKTFKA